MKADISFDLKMTDNMSFVEGAFRLPGKEWEVFVFSRYDLAQPEVEPARWASGITGVFVRFPKLQYLNKKSVMEVLGNWLNVTEWHEAAGPDSMQLR